MLDFLKLPAFAAFLPDYPVCARTFSKELEAIAIDSSSGNPYGIPRHAHGVLTNHFTNRSGDPAHAAFARAVARFRERLQSNPRSTLGEIMIKQRLLFV